MYRNPIFGHYAGSLIPMCWCLPRICVEEGGLVIVHRVALPGGL